MFERAHHQRIYNVLQSLDSAFLEHTACYFGGGTAIVLALGEYRESVGIDFLCASADGYRALRSAVFERGLHDLFSTPPQLLRDHRADRYGIRAVLAVDNVPIKFEIIHEDRIALTGERDPRLGVPVLARADLYGEKLLANTDRYADNATANRDIIDLAMMIEHWGPVPESAWRKARQAYGQSIDHAFENARVRLQNPGHLAACLRRLHMDTADYQQRITRALRLSSEWTPSTTSSPSP